MGRKTVKRRIFLSNTWMVIVTLLIFLCVNLLAAKIYTELIEQDFRVSLENTVEEDALEDLFASYTIHRNEFFLLVAADGVLCIAGLILVSQIFTKKLTEHIMTPLDALTEGAERIRNNDLTEDVEYLGDAEFEEVCDAFNNMRRSVLKEQERNKKYEKSRTDMIAGISHDLRTPLTAVRGTIKGLLDGIADTPEKQERFLTAAYRRTGDMELLLKQLFYLSTLETGNLPLHLQRVDMAEFVDRYQKEKIESIEAEGIELFVETDGDMAVVDADVEQLNRIFDNLLENSRKYAQADPLKIQIKITQTTDTVQVVFSDNGIGVEKEKLPYIFEEFYRGDESRNQKEGNGLGLYIVKYLIEAMGGNVRAESADGFCIYMLFQKSHG